MFRYNMETYNALLGKISEGRIEMAAKCISQCAGCTCKCRCSCSGGCVADFEWEEV